MALSYIYIRKDITYIQDPVAQGLLKAFLKALYTDEYITECEKEFGFVRVSGNLRQKALDAIESLTTSPGAANFTFEFATDKRVGQGDYVISSKRSSYSEVEQDSLVELVALLEAEVKQLRLELNNAKGSADDHEHGSDDNGAQAVVNGADIYDSDADWEEKESQLTAALALASVSFCLWMLAIIFILVKYVLKI